MDARATRVCARVCMQSLGGRERMHHSLDRRTVEALLRLQALLPGTLVRRARVRRILVDEGAGGARGKHGWQQALSNSLENSWTAETGFFQRTTTATFIRQQSRQWS